MRLSCGRRDFSEGWGLTAEGACVLGRGLIEVSAACVPVDYLDSRLGIVSQNRARRVAVRLSPRSGAFRWSPCLRAAGLTGTRHHPAPDPTSLGLFRVLRSGSVPTPPVVPCGSDRQCTLCGLSRCALPDTFQPRPRTLWQQQRYLHLVVSPAPGHLLPGPLHWGSAPGHLHR